MGSPRDDEAGCYTPGMTRRLSLLALIAVAGCSSYATYPSIETDTALALTNATYQPAPEIMATTLAWIDEQYGSGDTVVFNLPAGMVPVVYDRVVAHLGDATPMTAAGQAATPLLELRIRGLSAQADVIYPTSSGTWHRSTIYLSTTLLKPWAVERERTWNVPVTDWPAPNYPDAVAAWEAARSDSQATANTSDAP